MDFVMSNDPTTSKPRGFFRDFRSGPAAKGPVRSYTTLLTLGGYYVLLSRWINT